MSVEEEKVDLTAASRCRDNGKHVNAKHRVWTGMADGKSGVQEEKFGACEDERLNYIAHIRSPRIRRLLSCRLTWRHNYRETVMRRCGYY